MNISTRTPEGDPNQCPICGHSVASSRRCRRGTDLARIAVICCGSAKEIHCEKRSSLLQILEMRVGPIPIEMRSAIDELIDNADYDRLVKIALAETSSN